MTDHAAVPYTIAIDTTSGSYHFGAAAGELLLVVSVAVVIWKLVASIPRRRGRDRLPVQPMAYAALSSAPGPAALPGSWKTFAPPETLYAEPVIMPRRRGPHRAYWIPAAVIVTIAAGGYLWQLASPHRPGVPTGTGVSPAAATAEPPPGPGQVYRSTDGHFAVRFLGQPVELSKALTNQALTMSTHTMADQSHGCVVEGVDISPAVPDGETDNVLRGMVAGATGGGAITRESETTFQGRPAYEADFVQGDGRTFTVEAVLYGSQRSYLLFAPSGPTFAAMADSFVALP